MLLSARAWRGIAFALFAGAALLVLITAYSYATMGPAAGLGAIALLLYVVAAFALLVLGYLAWRVHDSARVDTAHARRSEAMVVAILIGYLASGLVYVVSMRGPLGADPLIIAGALLSAPILLPFSGRLLPLAIGVAVGVATFLALRARRAS